MSQISIENIVNGQTGDATPLMANLNAMKNRINLGMESDNIAAGAINGSHLGTFGAYTLKLSKGVDVASTASLTLGNDGNFFDITGTTGITSITAKTAGTIVHLQFDGILTVTDGSNLKLAGNFVTAAESTLSLVSDGTNWFEITRSPNAVTLVAATQAEQEAASLTTVYTTPGRQQYHPGMVKGWVVFDGTGASPITAAASHGLSGTITKSATGIYVITWATAFSSANYCVQITAATATDGLITGCVAKTTTTTTIETAASDGSNIDGLIICVSVMGDQ